MILNVTASGKALDRALNRSVAFHDSFSPGTEAGPSVLPDIDPSGEQLIVPAAVGYASRMMPASLAGTVEHSRELLLGHLLKSNFLWEEIRMKGGAYGAFSSANGAEGLFSFTSYRDPDPARSLGVFKKALETMAGEAPSREMLDQSVIGIVGKDAKPLSPGEKSMMGFRRDLYDISDELRRKNRRQILSAEPEDVKTTAQGLLESWEEGVSIVLAGEELAEAAASAYPEISSKIEIPY